MVEDCRLASFTADEIFSAEDCRYSLEAAKAWAGEYIFPDIHGPSYRDSMPPLDGGQKTVQGFFCQQRQLSLMAYVFNSLRDFKPVVTNKIYII